ncbi:MAG: hypothetical protein SFV17_01700 [Candidatus Obscuribacter sp.]|nr:hypothetical protein [Candidatus Obscuribacter sp.]MBK9279541.1 hypothetical protein [Candidatus Obscuribacter sp.]MBL8086189.1 hypothetical protein [Candidatus Obscuribacter sp.]MDX1985377.1 hypothetical protein [Candidatus Obscuribacter sp.]HMY01906.1 hypothetical protein [Candidatus Obscuribacter sp.]
MKDTPLSADERRCLAMWFRQAIAKLELEEVTQVMLKEFPPEGETSAHRSAVARRRATRGRVSTQAKQLV